jgi:hypothetical protein
MEKNNLKKKNKKKFKFYKLSIKYLKFKKLEVLHYFNNISVLYLN